MINNKNYYKIGITNLAPQKRLTQINPDYQLLHSESFLLGKYAYEKEQEILKKHNKYLAKEAISGMSSGWTEVFVKDVLKLDKMNSQHYKKQTKCYNFSIPRSF